MCPRLTLLFHSVKILMYKSPPGDGMDAVPVRTGIPAPDLQMPASSRLKIGGGGATRKTTGQGSEIPLRRSSEVTRRLISYNGISTAYRIGCSGMEAYGKDVEADKPIRRKARETG